jgi:hypothetical protein
MIGLPQVQAQRVRSMVNNYHYCAIHAHIGTNSGGAAIASLIDLIIYDFV